MSLTWLKPVRVTVSLVSFALILCLFIDFSGKLPFNFIRGVLFLQFIPSLVQFFQLFTAAAVGFAFVLLLTILFGRVYCSFLCPLGTIYDIITGIKSRIRKKKRFRFMKPQYTLHYGLLLLTVVLALAGSMILVNILDPYSLAGRIFSDIVRPLFYVTNNALALILERFNNYALYLVPFKHIPWPSIIATFSIMLAIGLLAYYKARWYCNAVCPTGALLGLISRFSIFRISISESDCQSCGLCARECKAGCIDMKSKRVDFDRCVTCYNCFRACEYDGFRYTHKKEKKELSGTNRGRRAFMQESAAGVATLAGALTAGDLFAANPEPVKRNPATPPGSVSVWNYTSKCTACHLCISACPTKVIQPSLLEFGIEGIFQPKMNFEAGYCNFDCVICTEICPTGAIRSLTLDQKHTTQIGVSKLLKETCVVVEKKTACGACSEHCPTKAVEMVPYEGTLKIPLIDEKICVGCGACEHVCPTRPIRAIYVESHKYHRVAMKPMKKIDNVQRVKKATEDFPF
jgi:ferredoxin/cytochrome b subunit of formate dehydrogenase